MLFSNIVTGASGAALRVNAGTLNLHHATLSDNVVTGDGGGVHVAAGSANIFDSTFTNNQATIGGGAISVANIGTANIYNTTISGNNVSGNGAGLVTGGTTTLVNVTIATNTSSDVTAGNVHRFGGTLNVTNSLIAQAQDNLASPLVACTQSGGFDPTNGVDGNSISEDVSCELDDPSSQENVDFSTVIASSLADNGGGLLTHALVSSSPAIDAGNDTACGAAGVNGADQRGVSRPQDGDTDGTANCDIGAVEAIPQVCTVATSTPYMFGGVEINIDNTGTDLDCLLVEYVAGNHPHATASGLNDALETGRYWRIAGSQSDGTTPATNDFQVDVTLPYIGADVDSRACKWLDGSGSGFGWDCGTNADNLENTGVSVTRVNYTGGFSDWAVGDQVGPTAVSLQQFDVDTNTNVLPVVVMLLLSIITVATVWHVKRSS